MQALAIYKGGVNVRESPSTTAKALRMTSVPDFAALEGIIQQDGDPLRWLHVRFDDGVEGWTREDVTFVVGNLTLLNYGCIPDVTLAATALKGAALPAITVIPSIPTPVPATPGANGSASKWAAPVNPYINTNGYNPPSHLGDDLAGAIDTNVYARGKGKVWQSNPCGGCPNNGKGSKSGTTDEATNYGFGNEIITEHAYADLPSAAQAAMDGLHLTGGFLYVIYGHLDSLSLSAGKDVTNGTLLGKRGTSGNSSGPHLHVEVRVRLKSSDRGLWSGDPATVIDPSVLFAL